MTFKFFTHLVMAYLVSGWWSVVGEHSDEESVETVLKAVSEAAPQNRKVYYSVLNKLVQLEAGLDLFKTISEKQEHETRNMKLYLDIAQAAKIRDWIVDIEVKFPLWLSYLDVDRFIKWALALNFVEGSIFDDLRERIRNSDINVNTFANEMYSIFEDTSSLIAHELPGVPKPTSEGDIEIVCGVISENYEIRRWSACRILLQTLSANTKAPKSKLTPRDTNISSSIANTFPTKFFAIVITHYNESKWESRLGLQEIVDTVQSNLEFRKQNCSILDQFLADPGKIDNTQHGRRHEANLPAVLIRMGFPLNLRGEPYDELEKNYAQLKSVMSNIKADLLKSVPKSADGNVFVEEEFISSEWSLGKA